MDNITYNWDTGETTNVVSVVGNEAPMQSWTVTVTDQFGCEDSETITLEVLESSFEIPNVFTPDNDSFNDMFGPVISGENIEVLSIKIFNRWGEKVHDSFGPDSAWNGEIDGKPAPTDVYVFFISLQLPTGEIENRTGDLTLIR